MAELVDALDSKSSSGNRVWVRFPLRVLTKRLTCYVLAFFVSARVLFGCKNRKRQEHYWGDIVDGKIQFPEIGKIVETELIY